MFLENGLSSAAPDKDEGHHFERTRSKISCRVNDFLLFNLHA